jgi:hypothetical protein
MYKLIKDIVQGDVLITSNFGVLFVIDINQWRPNIALLTIIHDGTIKFWPRLFNLTYKIL